MYSCPPMLSQYPQASQCGGCAG
uniref:Uncharacterized protein n=1 Tax=Anguilla anguilla TaxID=7936 RepID=A0A0E9SR93_ANGAN